MEEKQNFHQLCYVLQERCLKFHVVEEEREGKGHPKSRKLQPEGKKKSVCFASSHADWIAQGLQARGYFFNSEKSWHMPR